MRSDSETRRIVRAAAIKNGWTFEAGLPWVGPDGVTYRSKDEFTAAVVAAAAAEAHAVIWLEFPVWLRKGSEGQEHALTRLMADARTVYELGAATVRDVADARALGASWQHVGMALGISAEGARSRYGRPAGPAARGPEAAGG